MNARNDQPEEISFDEFERRKQADRKRLEALPPEDAQREVDSVLHPDLWTVSDPKQLDWPGDLADDMADDAEEDQ